MRSRRRNANEQLQLVAECRASGLTIADWCRREGIAPDTYHTWVCRLKEKGLLETPAVVPQTFTRDPFAPDIVKVEVTAPSGHIPERSCSDALPFQTEEYALPRQTLTDDRTVMEITFGEIRIKVTNQVCPQLLADTIRLLGGEAAC